MTKTTATPSEIAQCRAIFDRIDDLIPSRGYVNSVREELKKSGITTDYSDSQIQQTRARRTFHLEIAQAFERLYAGPAPSKQTSSIIRGQKLNPPTV